MQDDQWLKIYQELGFWASRGRSDKVVGLAHRLLAMDPEAGFVHRLLGLTYIEEGNRKLANHHLGEALRLMPEDQASHEFIALLNSESLFKRAGDKHAIMALSLDPDSIEAWTALALSAKFDDLKFCLTCVGKVLSRDPDNAVIRLIAGEAVVFAEEGEHWRGAAEGWFRAALTADPNYREAHKELGLLLVKNPQRRGEGLDCLRSALALAPEAADSGDIQRVLRKYTDPVVRFLSAPKAICLGAITKPIQWLEKAPLLVIFFKVYLVVLVISLAGLVLWSLFLWPVRSLYQYYVNSYASLRATAFTWNPKLAILVPPQRWLRQLFWLFLLVAWWFLVGNLLVLPGHFIESYEPADFIIWTGIGAAVCILLLGIGFLIHASRRRKSREKEMKSVAGLSQ
ncbi:MAG: hypothetical protein Q7Q71_15925 [Verrucomicrobiota bacterium JB023]|nr:hypothetical protein [Verrucomicrobiota bacterium JB023]